MLGAAAESVLVEGARVEPQGHALRQVLFVLQVLLYSGDYGVAHDSDTVVGGLIRHHNEGSGTFGLWLNAIGSGADLVEQQLRETGIPMIRSRPGPLEELPRCATCASSRSVISY
jgi:hypothetical protein